MVSIGPTIINPISKIKKIITPAFQISGIFLLIMKVRHSRLLISLHDFPIGCTLTVFTGWRDQIKGI